jgi:hypothetical protein
MINYWAYPGEIPVFDFSGITDLSKYSCRQVGVRVEGDWLYLKGLELKGTLQLNMDNHESWCVYVYGGNNNVFELLNAHHNRGPGFFVQQGGNNTFLNCDSHENEDTLTSNGDGQSADGFGCHPNQTGDTCNLFYGCRSWWNSDDAYDFIARDGSSLDGALGGSDSGGSLGGGGSSGGGNSSGGAGGGGGTGSGVSGGTGNEGGQESATDGSGCSCRVRHESAQRSNVPSLLALAWLLAARHRKNPRLRHVS